MEFLIAAAIVIAILYFLGHFLLTIWGLVLCLLTLALLTWGLLKFFADDLGYQIILSLLILALPGLSFVLPNGQGTINLNHYQYTRISRQGHLCPHDYENKGLAKPKLNRTAYRKLQHFTVNPYNYYHDQDHQLKLIYQIYRHQTHKRVHQLSE